MSVSVCSIDIFDTCIMCVIQVAQEDGQSRPCVCLNDQHFYFSA